ncbi:MAG: glycine--tRNA ligase subunit alpha, partial [Candidatus Omnitrophica bacterium]|nr:glycine--tRNA ligase subunit alpha [Candidatus Omnitrophota bacterium]
MEKKITFEEIFSLLEKFWLEQGCVVWQPHHEMVGAGTANPATLMRVLGPEPWNVAYVEPSFRPDDGRYAENPNRMQMHHQYQVILKPIPENVQELYLESLKLIGLSPTEHDIRFVEDNWESPALGAWGLGWEVWSDGMEITQFTYFQQAGGITLNPPACEITYGLERIAMYLQDVNSVWDLAWNDKIQYGDLLKNQEVDFCVYNFEVADIEKLRAVYQIYEEEAQRCIDQKLIAPAYDYGVKCSHTFNILDARGAISVAERVNTFKRIRDIVRDCASLYVERREELGFPNMKLFPARQAPEMKEKISEPAAPESFVLEIGMEELPSSEAEGVHQSFSDLIVKTLEELRIEYKSMQFLATPRRLAVLVEEMAPKQKNLVQTVRGPRRDIIESNPKALQGFLRKNQITEEDVEYQQINGAEFATAEKKIEGLFSTQVLAEQIPQILSKLDPRKPMRWLASEHVGEEIAKTTFSRPIRWFVCLFGADIVSFNYAGIQSGRTTRGGRFDESPSVEIPSAAEYKSIMEKHAIALDRTERREHIAKQIEAIAARHNGSVDQNDALLNEVTDLVECPTVFLGDFSEDFLCLPEEVLKLVAEKYQRYFLLRDANGRISNHFIGVRNGGRENLHIVQEGNERVFRARLTDAAFFYNKDQEDSLEVYLQNTAKLTYHEKIGSMR